MAMECQRCLLCHSQSPDIWKAQVAAQRNAPLEDMASMGSAGTHRGSTPFSIGPLSISGERGFWEVPGASHRASTSFSISQLKQEASRSFTHGLHPLFPHLGGDGAFQELHPWSASPFSSSRRGWSLPGAWLSRAPPYPPQQGGEQVWEPQGELDTDPPAQHHPRGWRGSKPPWLTPSRMQGEF